MTISDDKIDTAQTESTRSGDNAPIFNDGKDPQALRTIGEVAGALGIRPHVLRYWEEQFAALAPIKRSGSRRYYRPEDIALIAEIDRLVHREGYTLRGAAKVIDGKLLQGSASIVEVSEAGWGDLVEDDFAQKLAGIRDALAAGLAAA
ncbi:MAG TPA: MerR family transcriptional regulator [Novosphingobium sp.]|nr:MerR family transcriptional regulator [Novosphingobium sp.]